MKVLITGANGQLGYELQRGVPENFELICADRQTLDIASQSSVSAFFEVHRPNAVINAAAYTAVDKAETSTETAFAVNTQGAYFLAEACLELKIPMVQVSTDFVFDGNQTIPYKPSDKTSPVSVYGESKLEGEKRVLEVLNDKAIVIRTAWVYSSHGSNFVKTMLRLMKEKDQLGIVADQIGTPTSAKTLAQCCWRALDKLQTSNIKLPAILNWTDAGTASWYDFAVAIQEEAISLGILENSIPIKPIPASAYPTPAKRPAYSVLDKQATYKTLEMPVQHWRENLRSVLGELSRKIEKDS